MSKPSKVTAFQYDNTRTGADHDVQFGVVPGTWTPNVPVLAEAFGMTDDQMRDTIAEFNLPIVEVEVAERDAVSQLDRGPNRFESEQDAVRVNPKPDDRVRMTKDGPIPAAPRADAHPPLQPLTAAMQARDTVRSQGGSMEDAAEAARDAGGDAGAEVARMAELGAEREQEIAQAVLEGAGQHEPSAEADQAAGSSTVESDTVEA